MSMEFFAYLGLRLLRQGYRQVLLQSLVTIAVHTYGTMVDHFQHIVYEHPNTLPNSVMIQRTFKVYMPWVADEIPFYGEKFTETAIFWRPFYYIDLCLAQTVFGLLA